MKDEIVEGGAYVYQLPSMLPEYIADMLVLGGVFKQPPECTPQCDYCKAIKIIRLSLKETEVL